MNSYTLLVSGRSDWATCTNVLLKLPTTTSTPRVWNFRWMSWRYDLFFSETKRVSAGTLEELGTIGMQKPKQNWQSEWLSTCHCLLVSWDCLIKRIKKCDWMWLDCNDHELAYKRLANWNLTQFLTRILRLLFNRTVTSVIVARAYILYFVFFVYFYKFIYSFSHASDVSSILD